MISLFKRSLATSAAAMIAMGGIVFMAHGPAAAAPTTVASTASADGNCGVLDVTTADAATIAAATTCLQHAYSSCQSAVLRATWESDTITTERLISVSPGDYACMVVESVTRTPKASGTDSSDDFRCAGVSVTDGGIVLNRCGADGDVRIASAAH